jgi:unsaturated chondroitin disaccharide hydrolase
LQTAEACANFYIEQTPDHGVPPNDWDEPSPANPYESSAAAIAASGLFQLARLTGDPAHARHYHAYALRIMETLTTPEFLAVETPGWEGILKHGMYHERLGLGVNESVMWGDYFFLEAAAKVLGDE